MPQSDDFFYDDDQSITFIRNYLPQELKGKFTDDDLIYIVDLIYEYYENKGFLNDDADDDKVIEIDETELITFVIKQAKKDQVGKFEPDEVTFVVQGELAYCESINLFD
ncbi:MAG: hypothetical protein LBM08_10565 [Dysgonamonadaceae bacterium]|jgi:hypothetical protein|nr:hypothetical protein [Dysgonamonadaceae bacterium]